MPQPVQARFLMMNWLGAATMAISGHMNSQTPQFMQSELMT